MLVRSANFMSFLKHIKVPTVKTQMTFGVSRNAGEFEWAGTSLSSVFAQRQNLVKPSMWRLIFDIIRFNQFALEILRRTEKCKNPSSTSEHGVRYEQRQESVGEYLEREGYSQTFRDNYLIPMTAAVWSTSPEKCSLEFPVVTLIRFMWNHHLLSTVSRRPDWLTVSGGARQYIDAVLADVPDRQMHLETKVTALQPCKDGRVVLRSNKGEQVFDHVILATHGDQALDIMSQAATPQERRVLGSFTTNRNVAVLHSDVSLMPRRRVAWSAWNYMTESPFPPTSKTSNIPKICLTYCMNLLQHLPEQKFGSVLVTLNPLSPIDPQLVQGIWEYAHPCYNAEAIAAQGLLSSIQNKRGISYCGAWTKYGFHEDGFSSGLAVAMNHLGATLPFEFVDSTFSRGGQPTMTMADQVGRIVLLIIQLLILVMEAIHGQAWEALDRQISVLRKQ